jgi:NAD(P)H dehydrogenase (quinone)
MNILVVYYSTYGHTYKLAQAVVEGAQSAPGMDVKLLRVPELVPEEIFQQNEAMRCGRDMQREVPIATMDDLEWADGIAFGSPTRYGNMAAQMKNYIDQAGPLWARGALEGKVATCFTSSATMHGGQETTLVTMWIPLVHLGMIVLGVPYSLKEINITDRGGGPYGASIVVADRPPWESPNELEQNVGRAQGKRLAEITTKVRG